MISRRSFIRCTAAGGALTALGHIPAMAQSTSRPLNILMIPVDDLKPVLGCYGDKEIITPNIDRLAARGTIFLNNACQQAVCGPTRASLMTGLYPDSTGVWDLHTPMRSVNPDVLTLPQYLIQQGYETTGVGKTYHAPGCADKYYDKPSWSIPYASEPLRYAETQYGEPVGGYLHPETRKAFERGIKAVKASGKKFRSGGARRKEMEQTGGPMTSPATECLENNVPDEAYKDGAIAAAACRLLEKFAKGDKPFFLSVGLQKPHLPFVAPKKYWDMYNRDDITIHPFQEQAQGSPTFAYHNYGELRSYSDMPSDSSDSLTEEQQRTLLHGYRACVSYIDAQVGKLLDKLEELGLAENTVICLWGDHGWHLGDHQLWCKHTNYEQAVRAPLIIAAPGFKGGQKCSSPSGHIDVFPTLCALAGHKVPGCVQGKDLTALLRDPSRSVRKAILSQYPRKVNGKPVMGYTLRDQRYRYIKWVAMNYRKGERKGLLVDTELYDYQTDPLEKVNLADSPEHAEIVRQFEDEFKALNVAQHTGVMLYEDDSQIVNGLRAVDLKGQDYSSFRIVPATHAAFDNAHEITVFKIPEGAKRSTVAYRRAIAIDLKKGHTYKMSFYCRSSDGAQFYAIMQRNGKPYTTIGKIEVKAGDAWRKFEIIGKPQEDYPADKAVLTCHLATQLQTLQFADVRIEEVE